MNWKKASEFQPPLKTKILVKLSPEIPNDYCGSWPGKAVLAGKFLTARQEEYRKLDSGLYEKVITPKRYFDEVEPERWDLADDNFEWIEFPE